MHDLHCRAAHFFATKADVIVMPRMEVYRIISRRSVLTPATKRNLLGWKHGAFLRRLAVKCHDVEFDHRYPDKGSPSTTHEPEQGSIGCSCSCVRRACVKYPDLDQ